MRGVWTALVTPFDASGKIDEAAWKRLLRLQREAGVAGVVPCGTTGESPTLSIEEKKYLINSALAELKGTGIGVMAGTGSNDTAETIELSAWASHQGVQSILVVTPYYNRPTQAGLEAHYRAVADAVDCEVVLYNVPIRTSVSLTAETVARLAAHPRIRAVKESTGNVGFSSEIRDRLREAGRQMDLLSGDDGLFLPLLAIGATGLVSVTSNLAPREVISIQTAFESGDRAGALAMHERLYPIFRDIFIESNPSPIKAALAYAGICRADVRLPLVQLTTPSLDTLHATLRRCGIREGAHS